MREHNKTTGNVGRPREFDEDEALAKIMSLFWKQGYEGTGLSDIVEHTGLQKGSLYKAFGSKHGMYVSALTHYEKLAVDAAVKALKADGDPEGHIYAFLNAPIEAAFMNHDKTGCFLCNASADYAALDKDTRMIVERGYGKLQRALKHPIAKLRHDLDAKDVQNLAAMVLSVYSGLRIMARASVEQSILEGARDTAMTLLRPA